MVFRSYTVARQLLVGCAALLSTGFGLSVARAVTWPAPALDAWVYLRSPSGGGRPLASTFTGGLEVDEAGQFVPRPFDDPARMANVLVAFNTTTGATGPGGATGIPVGLPPHSYRIHSITLKATVERAGTGELLYQPDFVPNEQILAEFKGLAPTTGRPFELYGVGFQTGYTGVGFGPASPGPPLLEESSSYYAGGAAIAYPIAADPSACCGFTDVTNSLTGGYSNTAAGNTTAPFNPTPWALGQTNLPAGTAIADGTEFTFTIGAEALKSSSVRQYLQAGLAKGQLALMLSSWNATTELGGAGAYPNWYMKEFGTSPPTLEIQYELVEPVAGDYDGDGVVDGRDFLLWQCSFGAEATALGGGADGNANGLVDGGDLQTWASAGALPTATPAPEPCGWALAATGAAVALRRRGRRGRVTFPEKRLGA